MIIQSLRTFILVNICSDLICIQSQWFSAKILQKFAGNGQNRRLFSISSRFLKTSMRVFPFQWLWKPSFAIMSSFKFSLWQSPVALKLEPYWLQLCKNNCRNLVFWVFPEQILFRGVFKPNQTSSMEFIAKIIYVFKYFDYFL